MPKVISKNLRAKLTETLNQFVKQNRYIFYSREISHPQYLKLLKNLGLTTKIKAGVYLIKNPDEERHLAIQKNLPAIIKFLGEEYGNWCLGGWGALDYYLHSRNFEKKIRILTDRMINKNLKIGNYLFEFRSDKNLTKELITFLPVNNMPLNLLSREYLIINLLHKATSDRLPEIKRVIPLLFRDYRFDWEKLNQYAKKEKKSTAFKIFKKILPEALQKIEISPVWIIQYKEQFERYLIDLKKVKTDGLSLTNDVDFLIQKALENKKYDAYHSTTIEGYNITPQEIVKLLEGKLDLTNEKRIRDFLAIKGHSMAFDFLIEKIKNDFGHPKITEELIRDIQINLWRPGVDYGIVKLEDLGLYRRLPVYIRNSFYVPPNWEKVPDLMKIYIELINQVKNEIYRSILSHGDFVKIHPFVDGNGRTARFLMNYVLLCSGYQWITIRNDQRDKYFQSLERAQVKGEILPFAEFIVKKILEAKKS